MPTIETFTPTPISWTNAKQVMLRLRYLVGGKKVPYTAGAPSAFVASSSVDSATALGGVTITLTQEGTTGWYLGSFSTAQLATIKAALGSPVAGDTLYIIVTDVSGVRVVIPAVVVDARYPDAA